MSSQKRKTQMGNRKSTQKTGPLWHFGYISTKGREINEELEWTNFLE